MSVNILTREDLEDFKEDLLAELKTLLKKEQAPVKKWLKTEEVKRLLKISTGTLQTFRVNGTLAYTKLGGILYYDYEHIEKVMQQSLHTAAKL